VAADRNPWLKSPAADVRTWSTFKADSTDAGKNGNCNAHQFDGQEVLFLDSHVSFEKRAFCSIEDDNIYTVSAKKDSTGQFVADPYGVVPAAWGAGLPKCRKDAVLVHDPDKASTDVR
jgi:hypothetical protein